MKGYRLEAGK